ncbi:lin-52, partial [Pristionchus pacificus]|uniref:Uncharacterized protein n=1 Tax=Pristionchus pacificus TaxID=54126 RepID=A0A8R1Z7L9_PRIPA
FKMQNMDYNMGMPRQSMGSHHTYTYQQSQPIQIRDPTPLICNEVLDRSSPELWPEAVPGLVEKNRDNGLQLSTPRPHKFKTEMDQDDVRLVNDLGRLSADQLMEYVKNLQNNAFILGVEEKKQFAKGKFLKIFEKRSEDVYS